jgi:hypothetical protein
MNPATVVGGNPSTGTVTLTSAAPTGGITVTLSNSNTSAVTVPTSVNIAAGATSNTFSAATAVVSTSTPVTITAAYGSVNKTATLTVDPPPPLLPSRAQVLAAIENVNNYWIAHNTAGNSDWNRATYFTGDLAAYDATGQANYLTGRGVSS